MKLKSHLFGLFIFGLFTCHLNLSAQIIWSNDGTRSGWSGFAQENLGTVAEVETPNFGGSKGLRCRQIFDPNYSGRYHASYLKSFMGRRNQDRWYGFAFYIPENWEDVNNGFAIWQMIGNYGGRAGFKPNAFFNLWGSEASMILFHGDVDQRPNTRLSVGTLPKGQWMKIVIQAKWRDDDTGLFKMWIDGVEKINHTGPNCFLGRNEDLRMDYTIYATGWRNNGLIGTQNVREFYFDQIKVGDGTAKYDDVVPVGQANTSPNGGDPVVGVDYRLENVTFDQWLQGNGTVFNVIAKTNVGNKTKWQLIRSGEPDYFRIENQDSGKWIQAANGTNLALVTNTSTGDKTKWKLIASNNGSFRLENKYYNEWLKSEDGNANVLTVPKTNTGGKTKWRFVPVSNNLQAKIDNEFIGPEHQDDISLNMYPNPSSNYIYLEFRRDRAEEVQFKILDMSGRILKTSNLNAHEGKNDFYLDIEWLSAGNYIFSMEGSNRSIRKIFVKD